MPARPTTVAAAARLIQRSTGLILGAAAVLRTVAGPFHFAALVARDLRRCTGSGSPANSALWFASWYVLPTRNCASELGVLEGPEHRDPFLVAVLRQDLGVLDCYSWLWCGGAGLVRFRQSWSGSRTALVRICRSWRAQPWMVLSLNSSRLYRTPPYSSPVGWGYRFHTMPLGMSFAAGTGFSTAARAPSAMGKVSSSLRCPSMLEMMNCDVRRSSRGFVKAGNACSITLTGSSCAMASMKFSLVRVRMSRKLAQSAMSVRKGTQLRNSPMVFWNSSSSRPAVNARIARSVLPVILLART